MIHQGMADAPYQPSEVVPQHLMGSRKSRKIQFSVVFVTTEVSLQMLLFQGKQERLIIQGCGSLWSSLSPRLHSWMFPGCHHWGVFNPSSSDPKQRSYREFVHSQERCSQCLGCPWKDTTGGAKPSSQGCSTFAGALS